MSTFMPSDLDPVLLFEQVLQQPKIDNDTLLTTLTRELFSFALANHRFAQLLLNQNSENQFLKRIKNLINEQELVQFAEIYPDLMEQLITKAGLEHPIAAKMRAAQKNNPFPELQLFLAKHPIKSKNRALDQRTLLAEQNPHVVRENNMKGIRVNQKFIPMVNRKTRDFNKPLCSVGSVANREVILLDPEDAVLKDLYEQLKTRLPKTDDPTQILRAVRLFTGQLLRSDTPDEFINSNLAQGRHIIPLSEFILNRTGVCRHHTLLNSYFLSRLSAKGEPLAGGEVIHHRQNFGNSGAHTWNIFRDKQGKIYSLDSLWANLTCISDNPGVVNELYNKRLKKKIALI